MNFKKSTLTIVVTALFSSVTTTAFASAVIETSYYKMTIQNSLHSFPPGSHQIVAGVDGNYYTSFTFSSLPNDSSSKGM